MKEEDTKRRYITKSLYNAGWTDDMMINEYYINPGKVYTALNGETQRIQKTRKFVDYLLKYPNDKMIAIVEAKGIDHDASEGLLQAENYAMKLNVPFAYSTNGEMYYEMDLITTTTRQLKMDEFPSPEELRQRYIKEKDLNNEQQELIDSLNYVDLSSNMEERYYQTAAIDKTIEAISKGQKRCLIVLATGTGKTYVASQIVWRLTQTKKVNKVLYLADRNILIQKPYNDEFARFGSSREIIKQKIDNAHQIYFGLYQMLKTDASEEGGDIESNLKLYQQVSPDFFDLIIVDECHRGSVREDSKWKEILEYFSSAIQIGMTATPKVVVGNKVREMDDSEEDSREDQDDNLAFSYFGEPLYVYSLVDGINDGYLAPFKVVRPILDIDLDGYTPYPGEVDLTGKELENRKYRPSEFDSKIYIDSRTKEVAKYITEYLRGTDRYQKTIIFCCNNRHAEFLRIALANENKDIMAENPRYITRITDNAPNRAADLSDFLRVDTTDPKLYPFIVTTSDLLTTGVDAKTTKLIVLDRNINSITLFKQILGRGTRLRLDCGKTEFVVMDFRGSTRLIQDDKWLGTFDEIKVKSISDMGAFVHDVPKNYIDPNEYHATPTIYHIHGNRVTLVGEQVSIMSEDGKTTTETLFDYTRDNIVSKYGSLTNFIRQWSKTAKHSAIANELKDDGILLEDIRKELSVSDDIDDFDLICYVAFNMPPLTRSQRVANAKKSKFYDKLEAEARKVIDVLLDKYSDGEIEDLNETQVLELQDFHEFGTPKQIINEVFDGLDNYKKLTTRLCDCLYKTEA